jgi:hypothetical protein
MRARAVKILGLVAATFVTILMLVSAVMKGVVADVNPEIQAQFVARGLFHIRYGLAFAGLALPVLYWYRRTSTLALVLLVGYWAGATATNLTQQNYAELPGNRHPEIWARFLGRPAGAAPAT